jgi:hypothetical protein
MAVAGTTKDIPQNINFAIKAIKYHSEPLQREWSEEALTQQMKTYTVRIECN